jgi:hypothetical protein
MLTNLDRKQSKTLGTGHYKRNQELRHALKVALVIIVVKEVKLAL